MGRGAKQTFSSQRRHTDGQQVHEKVLKNFPGGAVIKNSPTNARDMGSTPGLGRSHTLEQLSLCTTTTEPVV